MTHLPTKPDHRPPVRAHPLSQRGRHRASGLAAAAVPRDLFWSRARVPQGRGVSGARGGAEVDRVGAEGGTHDGSAVDCRSGARVCLAAAASSLPALAPFHAPLWELEFGNVHVPAMVLCVAGWGPSLTAPAPPTSS